MRIIIQSTPRDRQPRVVVNAKPYDKCWLLQFCWASDGWRHPLPLLFNFSNSPTKHPFSAARSTGFGGGVSPLRALQSSRAAAGARAMAREAVLERALIQSAGRLPEQPTAGRVTGTPTATPDAQFLGGNLPHQRGLPRIGTDWQKDH